MVQILGAQFHHLTSRLEEPIDSNNNPNHNPLENSPVENEPKQENQGSGITWKHIGIALAIIAAVGAAILIPTALVFSVEVLLIGGLVAALAAIGAVSSVFAVPSRSYVIGHRPNRSWYFTNPFVVRGGGGREIPGAARRGFWSSMFSSGREVPGDGRGVPARGGGRGGVPAREIPGRGGPAREPAPARGGSPARGGGDSAGGREPPGRGYRR